MNMKIREILAVLAVSALCGCTDFLDVVPDNIATIEMAFNNRANAEKYLATCYARVPLYGNQHENPGLTAGNDIWYYTMEDHYFSNTWAFGSKEENLYTKPYATVISSLKMFRTEIELPT